MNKKRIAREYLYFVICFAIGFFLLPLILFIIFAPIRGLIFGVFYGEFYGALLGKEESGVTAWLVVLGPYLLFQFIRSIVWAWKTVRTQ